MCSVRSGAWDVNLEEGVPCRVFPSFTMLGARMARSVNALHDSSVLLLHPRRTPARTKLATTGELGASRRNWLQPRSQHYRGG
jgi:hypothetical protein